MNIPEKTYESGWPLTLQDNDERVYVRLRDGKPDSEFSGESCLYGLLDADGYIIREELWVPVLGAIEDDMTLTGGPWMDAEELVKYDQTPIRIPDEPINLKEI